MSGDDRKVATANSAANKALLAGLKIGMGTNRLVWSLTRLDLACRYKRRPFDRERSTDGARELREEAVSGTR